MKFHHEPLAGGNASQLWLMLPGAYMKPANFIAAGFVEAVRSRGLPHDIALLEANIAEVADGSALLFLQDFLQAGPMRAQRVCLLGISLGAHLAMACLARAPCGPAEAAAAGRVASACLLAPYLGPREIAAEVAASGGLAHWQPPLQTGATEDIDRRIWQWLQQHPGGEYDLYLGYGSGDRFAKAHALAAQALPADRVDVQPGGHEWPVWTALWNRHLDQAYAR